MEIMKGAQSKLDAAADLMQPLQEAVNGPKHHSEGRAPGRDLAVVAEADCLFQGGKWVVVLLLS